MSVLSKTFGLVVAGILLAWRILINNELKWLIRLALWLVRARVHSESEQTALENKVSIDGMKCHDKDS